MKSKTLLNKIILILITLLQSTYILLEIKKDIVIGMKNLEQVQIKERMAISKVQVYLNELMILLVISMVVWLIVNRKKDLFVKNLKNNILFIIFLCAITCIISYVLNLPIGNVLENIWILFIVNIFLIIYYIYKIF